MFYNIHNCLCLALSLNEIKTFWTPCSCSYHLGDAEAVMEVVEGDVVVVAVDLEQEVLQDVQLDVERRQEVQVGEHHLEEHQHLRLLPLPVNNTAHRWAGSE